MAQDLITTKEAAAILGCSVWTVHRKAERGEIAVAQRLSNGAYLFDPDLLTKEAS
ncbi:MAG: helix-turn-helix domain-containing protein [Candidatus Nanopelagicales bacterium]